MKKLICIVDYGLGNIHSAEQSIKKVAADSNMLLEIKITSNPSDIKEASHLVLPGQGAFESCINGLRNINGMIDELSEAAINKKKPFLGICVGMQLLASKSYENGEHQGLNWIQGEIKKMPKGNIKLPHMGWNEIILKNKKNQLVKASDKNDFYFVHSYYFDCKHKENIIALSNYGIDFASIISKENIYGVQFHPEKSSVQGLEIIKNFINI